MKAFATILLCTTYTTVAAAAAVLSDESKLQATITTITRSLDNHNTNPEQQFISEGDWTTQLKCTGDFTNSQQPSLVGDEATCEAAKDATNQSCIWCDATQAIGGGLCVSQDQKQMLGQFWDQLCANSSTPAVNPVPPPPTPPPSPTPPPVAPAPEPAPDNGDTKCLMDSSGNVIADETTCSAQTGCVWCKVSFLNSGSCVTTEMKAQLPSFLCSADVDESSDIIIDEYTTTKTSSYLRGGDSNKESDENEQDETPVAVE